MARRPAGRTDKPWPTLMVVLALAVALLILLAGRREAPVERPVEEPPAEMIDGYAYTAMLVSRHPLWPALVDLEAAIEELSAEDWEPALPPIDHRFADIAFIESYILPDQQPRMMDLRRQWRESYPPLALPTDGLAEDLQARISWEAEQAARMVERRMARARAAESRRLAQLRARLVEQYQERLTNLTIQAAIRQDEAAEAAVRERDRVWQIIEDEIAATSAACDLRLAELEAELHQEAAERVERVRERSLVISAERRTTMHAAGAGLRDEMAAEMDEPWRRPAAADEPVSAELSADPANLMLAEIDSSREAAEAARREKAEEQRERMLEALGRMRAQIRAGTETAAKVAAYRRGVRLQTLPGDSARGRDVTGMVGDELEDFWSFAGD